MRSPEETAKKLEMLKACRKDFGLALLCCDRELERDLYVLSSALAWVLGKNAWPTQWTRANIQRRAEPGREQAAVDIARLEELFVARNIPK